MTTLICLGLIVLVFTIIACVIIEIEEREDEKKGKLTKSDLRELVRGDFFRQN